MNAIFAGLMGAPLLWGLIRGSGGQTAQAMLSGAGEGVQTALLLCGALAFFGGFANILRLSGAMERLSRAVRPLLSFLLGRDVPPDALPYAAMNLAANALGLGNAATPMGIEAAKRMAAGDAAGKALCMFLVINSSSVQLLPTTVIALRSAAGSASPGSVILPTLLATGISTLVGIVSCKAAEKWTRK